MLRYYVTLFAFGLCTSVAFSAEPRALFNGTSLEGWDTYLGKTSTAIPGHPKGEPIGLNKDPLGVYTVATVDGQPAIRISGQVFGALTSKDEFENYHLRFEVKWGEKKWPPRQNTVRDSGLLYHCVGPHGAGSGAWMKSFECQVQENDFGDFWSVAGVIVDVHADRPAKGPLTYRKDAPLQTGITSRIVRNPKADRLEGWNVVELYAVGGTAVHVINGVPNLVLTNLRQKVKQDGKDVVQPLTRGKIQLQSEGAEVFYRKITVEPITAIPEALLK